MKQNRKKTSKTAIARPKPKDAIGGGKPGPGRPRNVPNKITREIRQAIEEAVHDLEAEGDRSLIGEWVRRAYEELRFVGVGENAATNPIPRFTLLMAYWKGKPRETVEIQAPGILEDLRAASREEQLRSAAVLLAEAALAVNKAGQP